MTQFVHTHYKQAHISCVHACIHTHVLVAHRFGAACSPAGVRTGPSQWELHSGCSRCSTSLEISQQHMHHRLLAPWVQKRDSLQTWCRHERKHKKNSKTFQGAKDDDLHVQYESITKLKSVCKFKTASVTSTLHFWLLLGSSIKGCLTIRVNFSGPQ